MRRISSVIGLLFATGASQAALFSGGAFFSTAPNSQMGPVTNNLVITNTANGFIVSGQAIVNVAPGPVSGILVQWTVDRPLDATYGSGLETTTTALSGFSAPPVGVALNTAGVVRSSFTNYPIVSESFLPMTLVGGVDSPPWISLSNTTSPFFYTSGGVNYLRQDFFLDGIYLAGPGGSWVIDVPVESSVTTVPEAGSVVLALLGLGGLALPRLLRRRT